MEMTNAEIVMEYKQAKSPMKQIGILADQNLCTKADIVAVLREAGCDLPKYYQPKDTPVILQPLKEPAPELVPTELVKQLKVKAYDAIVSMFPEGGDAQSVYSFIDRITGIAQLIREVEK